MTRRHHPSFFARDERGVSPVIGTVLILVIMIFSIGGILAWGVPAIQGLQDRAEFQHVLTQFLQMDSQVRNLRDPQNTRVITLALSEGQLVFSQGERWVVSVANTAAYDGFHLQGWETGAPASVTIGGIATAGHDITVDTVSGGSFTTKASCSLTCPQTIGIGTADLEDEVVRIAVKSGSSIKAEAWIFNVGTISYYQSETDLLNRLHFSMGAVFSQQNTAFFVEETPTVKDPDYTISPKDTSLFGRILQLSGTATTLNGEGRRPIVFNLVDNYGASRGRPSFDPATMVRVQVQGTLEVPFCNYLDTRTNWFNQDLPAVPANAPATAACPTEGTSGAVNVMYDVPAGERMVFDMNHAVVTTTVRSL